MTKGDRLFRGGGGGQSVSSVTPELSLPPKGKGSCGVGEGHALTHLGEKAGEEGTGG